jgi:hypothetical protein
MFRARLAVVVAVLACPAGLLAQEAESPPPILSVSQWVCPNSALEAISADYRDHTLPVEQAMVAEGKLLAAGMFFHAWADEWNVGYYRTVSDMGALLDVIAEVGRRVEEQHPDLTDRNPFEACTAHKDNIYFMGPSTNDPATDPTTGAADAGG